MKIAIIGYSGAGKSTLADKLGKEYACKVLHLDRIHFADNWVERTDEEMIADAKRFMEQESWIIEGNYSIILYQERMEAANQIVILDFDRCACLLRAYARYRKYRGTTRPDMADGCTEKFDLEFIRWILWDGRSRKAKERYRAVRAAYPDKTIVLKNQNQLDCFWERTQKH